MTKLQLIAGITAISMLLVGMSIQRKNNRSYIEDTVIVSNAAGMGTLWDIAKEHCPADMDIYEYIEYIKKDNDCTALLHNGDVLTIRRYTE